MRPSTLLPAGVVAALFAAACASGPDSEGAPAPPTVTEVDGVRVVHNSAPAWGEEPGLRIAPEPALVLGVDVGEPAEMFTNPGAARLNDGRIVVFDRGSNEIRFFAAGGASSCSLVAARGKVRASTAASAISSSSQAPAS